MPRRRSLRPVSAALERAIEPFAPATPLAAVQSHWAQAVGEAIAAETTPVAERDGIVTVACSSSTWAQELDLLAEDTLEKLRAELPETVVLRGLRFTAAQDPV